MSKTVAGIMTAGLVPVAGLVLVGYTVLFGAAPADACTPGVGVVDAGSIPADASVAGFAREQLVNAAHITNAALPLGLSGEAQTLGVQAAIGESSLVNLDHGDGAPNPDGSVSDSLGLFQQQSSWGSVAERMDPTTAATLFFERLVTEPWWEGSEPSVAINRVQANADPYHYTTYRPAAVDVIAYLATVTRAGGESGECAVGGDVVALAQGLVAALDEGRLRFLEPRYADQIRNVAAGTATAECGLNLRTLQLITLALERFGSVGISDLNRQCTGSRLGAGTGSSHWIKGGGHAVDFYALGGSALTGGDVYSLEVLRLLGNIAPAGTRVGQVNCRAPVTLPGITQITDTCNHLHVDFAYADGPLAFG